MLPCRADGKQLMGSVLSLVMVMNIGLRENAMFSKTAEELIPGLRRTWRRNAAVRAKETGLHPRTQNAWKRHP